MKNSSDYVSEKVFKLNKKIARLQNKTEELFFRCLDEERPVEYFIKKLDELWGNIDHSFMNEEIEEYINIIQRNNEEELGIKPTLEESKEGMKTSTKLLLLIGLGFYLANEEKFTNYIKNRYEMYYNSPEYKRNKEEYLKVKVKDYTNQVIPYFDKETGEIIRYVQLSTYLAMKYNTELTRAGWEKTLQDAEYLGYTYFWIPPHSFSCKHCAEYQGRKLTQQEVEQFIVNAEEQDGDILHPNCKCTLLIYTPKTKLIKQGLSEDQIEQYYDIRQKTNSLTLKKERLLTDLKIQKELGNQDEVDKLKSQIKKINTQIKVLIDQLPTEELKKKVVAINR